MGGILPVPSLSFLEIAWKERNLILILGAIAGIGFLHWRLGYTEQKLTEAVQANKEIAAEMQVQSAQYNTIVKAVNDQQRGNDARQEQITQAAAQLAQKRAKSLPMDGALSDAYARLYSYQAAQRAAGAHP